jgi:RNA polymerase sigma-70 factor (sigma-E family)
MGRPDSFTDFVTEQGRALLRTAWLLTGDWAAAEDLVQTTFTKVWRHWDRVQDTNDAVSYVRRMMLNCHLKTLRRRWNGERPTAVLPEIVCADEHAASEIRASLRAALATLPPRQRAVVVLRYFNDLSEAQTAAELGCSVGTVKSQASRAMATLRSHPALAGLLTVEATR